ncbi:MAG: hypothetical protein U9R75_12030 [Candidatus Thermoplasmatota archaeon]|nr:hypothetical protein [Candidatus Thermoplasmatota archaeon]
MMGMIGLFLKEELRLRRSFSTALSLLIFPEMVLLGSLGGYLFRSLFMDSMTYAQLHLSILTGLFVFGISMGGVAFLGKEFIERSLGPVNMLAASSTYHPVDGRRMYLSYFLHDLIFYILLILLPSSIGLLLGTIIDPIPAGRFLIIISSQWSSFLLGLSMSLLVSSAVARKNRLFLLVIPITVLPLIALQLITGEVGAYIPCYLSIETGSWSWMLLTLIISASFASVGILLFQGVDVVYRKGSSGSYSNLYSRFFGFSKDRRNSALMAREFMNLIRGKVYIRMAFSMFFPMLVMTILVGIVGGMEGSPLSLNMPFLAVMVSFFTMSIYTHITNMDHLDHDQTLPIRTSDLIRVKIRVYLMISMPLSVFFMLIAGSIMKDPVGLLLSLPLVLVMVPYMGYVTAYLTGLWTNSMLFDSSVFIKYIALAVGPLMFATILSMMMEEMDLISFIGMAMIMIGSIISTIILSRSLEKKWKGAVLSSTGGTGQ